MFIFSKRLVKIEEFYFKDYKMSSMCEYMELSLQGRKETIMDKQKELAVKVMELANKITGWNFQMEDDGNFYYVMTTVTDLKRKNRMAVYYTVGKQYALLTVFSPSKEYNEALVYEEVKALPYKNAILSNYGVYATAFRNEGVYFNSILPLDVLENRTSSIVGAVMVELLDAMTEAINPRSRN